MHGDGLNSNLLLISRVNTLLELSSNNLGLEDRHYFYSDWGYEYCYLDSRGVLSVTAVRRSDDGHLVVDRATTEVEATVVTEGNLEGELALNSGITTNNLVLVVELSLWDWHSISSLGGGGKAQ